MAGRALLSRGQARDLRRPASFAGRTAIGLRQSIRNRLLSSPQVIRFMKTLIVGIARSGTSALYFKLKQALPETTCCLYEPPCFDPSDPGGSPNVLAKIVIGPPGEFDYTSFREFDKKIMIVRDPRDNVVSGVLYGPCATEVFRRDKA